ncbi:MAG TPA: hypothetical protein VHE60_18030 [Pyrinomonadaceae bacterium]|nr:hypothetical protein [Pyrinomonadaceae bacterium]
MKDLITQIGPYHLGQPVASASGLREFSADEYAKAEASGMRRTLRDEKLFDGPERLDLVATPWEGTIVASTEEKIYKICLQFNTRNGRFAKIVFRTALDFLVEEMGKYDEHRLLSKKYVWDRPTGNAIFYMMKGDPYHQNGPINSINLMFTARFIVDQMAVPYEQRL